MIRFAILLIALGAFAAAVNGKTAFDTLIYTHYAHETRYNVGNCDACHVSIVKSNKSRDDNYASQQQACDRIGCHDIKNHDSCFVCHTNANAKSPVKPKREIRFNHKIHLKFIIDKRSAQQPTGSKSELLPPATAQDKAQAIYDLIEKEDPAKARETFLADRSMLKKNLDPEAFKALSSAVQSLGSNPRPKAFLGSDCKVCHGYIDKMSYFTRQDMPPMGQCIECHKKEKIQENCDFCHTDRTITRSHGMEGEGGHGDLYYKAPRSCETCHESNHCDKCHKGQTSAEVHPYNYLHLHQFDVFSGQTKCEVCHDIHQSCDGCHMKSWGKIVDHRNAINGTQSCKSCHRGK